MQSSPIESFWRETARHLVGMTAMALLLSGPAALVFWTFDVTQGRFGRVPALICTMIIAFVLVAIVMTAALRFAHRYCDWWPLSR